MNKTIETPRCRKKVIFLFLSLYFLMINRTYCLTEADTDSDSVSIVSEYSNDPSCSTDYSFSSIEESIRRSFSEESYNSNISSSTDKSFKSCQSVRNLNPAETENIFNYTIKSLKEIYSSINNDLENTYVILEQDLQKLILNDLSNSLKFQNNKNRYSEILKQIYLFEISLQRVEDIFCQEIIIFKIENAPDKRINESEKIIQIQHIKKIIQFHIRNLLETANKLLFLLKSDHRSPLNKKDECTKLVKNYISKMETIKYRIANIDNRSLVRFIDESNSC
ncbi:MAG: hypothetical protein C0432_00420 [Candidatus Puniceispirillum sp.]|nr:hypothetical protein [Candidatus Pelagibacter sp.]MBA4282747.1 hypothetical protein [Candidatus Puniceispirillum sp.]